MKKKGLYSAAAVMAVSLMLAGCGAATKTDTDNITESSTETATVSDAGTDDVEIVEDGKNKGEDTTPESSKSVSVTLGKDGTTESAVKNTSSLKKKTTEEKTASDTKTTASGKTAVVSNTTANSNTPANTTPAGTTNNTTTAANSTAPAGTANSGGTGGVTTEATTQHTHVYDVPVYKTVHHDAVTETEEVEVYGWVPITETEAVNVCSECGKIMYNQGEVSKHFVETGDGNYHSDYIEVDTGETEWDVTGYEAKEVVVEEAYDEQVIDYYKCSCGARQ
jgi:hypothetical protein